jgi:hypothetical protein
MPFDNFYEDSDKARRRWWIYIGLAFLLLTGYWAFGLLVLPDFEHDRKQAEDWKRIESETEDFHKSERKRRVDDLCRYLPLPEQFFFLEKDLPTHFTDSTSIDYRFTSARQPEEIMPFFLIWFKNNGWKSINAEGSMFKKDTQMVTIRVLKPFDAMTGYEIQCYESDN